MSAKSASRVTGDATGRTPAANAAPILGNPRASAGFKNVSRRGFFEVEVDAAGAGAAAPLPGVAKDDEEEAEEEEEAELP